MKEQKKGKWGIIGMIALVVVLFIGVKIAFAALDLAIGQNQPDVIRQPLSTESGGASQWMLLTKDDKNEEVTQWLEKADRGDQAYWLERQEAGEYVLFLPMQDRMLDADDITVTEEKQEDGSAALVLRIRTSEDSEDAESGQLLIFQDFRSSWNGENVRVVLDGSWRYKSVLPPAVNSTGAGRIESCGRTSAVCAAGKKCS